MMLNLGYFTSTNTKNHITISISTNSYRPAISTECFIKADGYRGMAL